MKQHAKRNVSGNYELEFNCRRFEDRIDQEQHRCKDNWSYFPIKNVPSEGRQISMKINSKFKNSKSFLQEKNNFRLFKTLSGMG